MLCCLCFVALALTVCILCLGGGDEEEATTYKAANPKILATIILVWRFICNFLTIKKGKIPNVQSATEFSTEMIYVLITITFGLMHFP